MLGEHRPAAARTASRSASRSTTRSRSSYDDEVVKLIVSRCTEVESGGRMIDAILTNTVLPRDQRRVPDADERGARR